MAGIRPAFQIIENYIGRSCFVIHRDMEAPWQRRCALRGLAGDPQHRPRLRRLCFRRCFSDGVQ